jgi:uncharacterized protein (DUF1015 family)
VEVRALRGWRYHTGAGSDAGPFIAPPYDVVSADDKAALLRRSRHNIVAVDLPCVPPREPGSDEAYRRAAALLEEWKSAGVLVQEQRPTVYVYEQTYDWSGRSYTRRALICGVRVTDVGEDVKAHESTFEGPVADRLKLMEHTRMQLSPVFGFYRDERGEMVELLSSLASGVPDGQGRLGGVSERLWVVRGEATIAAIAEALRGAQMFIADGHHRYSAALHYRDALRAGEGIEGSHEANFVMCALVEAADPGLLVLPTHRIVTGLKGDFAVDKLRAAADDFDWQRCSVEEAGLTDPDAFLRRFGPHAMGLMGARPAEIWIARLRRPEAMARAAPEQIDAWRRLDVAVLHKLIIDRALQPWRTDEMFITYTADASRVLAACKSGRAQLGIYLQATPLSAVETVALAGRILPHKSTYFYPKIATGWVLKSLT